MADSYSFLDAKQQLENEMMARQVWLTNIRTGQCRYESSAAEEELLENEIENRKIALEKLEAQSCCDCCGTQVDVRETFRIRMASYSEKLLTVNLMMEKVRVVSVECAECARREYDSQQRPERMVATKDEIDQAYEMLTPARRRSLLKFADWRVQGLGRASDGKTAEDLFQDVWVSTLTGAEDAGNGKHWNKSAVDFFGYLRGAIRNISFCWGQKFRDLESDLMTRNAEGDEISLLENRPSSKPAADECLSVNEQIERTFKIFANDKEASAVLRAWKKDMTTAREIMQETNLTKREYEAALKRIRCPKSALVIEDYEQVPGLLVEWLKQMGYAVHTACNSVEGLRLCRECGPFDVVMISYSRKLNKLNGVELAMDIFKKNPSQRMIITTTHDSEEDVVRPSELIHIPILLKPFARNKLSTVLQSFANTVTEKPATCCRRRRRRATAFRMDIEEQQRDFGADYDAPVRAPQQHSLFWRFRREWLERQRKFKPSPVKRCACSLPATRFVLGKLEVKVWVCAGCFAAKKTA